MLTSHHSSGLKIEIVTPAPRGSLSGNRVTAERWAKHLRDLGHHVRITTSYEARPVDVLIALHARRSHGSIRRFREHWPDGNLIVALPGTDLYRDIHHDAAARESLAMATRLVVLQEAAIRELPVRFRGRARVIHQSAVPRKRRRKSRVPPRLAIVGHLRAEKDPFRLTRALALLPEVAVTVVHAGKALAPEFEEEARKWMRRDPRYRWKGELPAAEARQLIADSEALVLSSIMEGGANVISEAFVCGVPLLASRIPSSEALLGQDYEGFFDAGDTRQLAVLIERFVAGASFRRTLRQQIRLLRPAFTPRYEREVWQRLLAEIA